MKKGALANIRTLRKKRDVRKPILAIAPKEQGGRNKTPGRLRVARFAKVLESGMDRHALYVNPKYDLGGE